jgi:thiol-disulfide isomerase/thioredoxin
MHAIVLLLICFAPKIASLPDEDDPLTACATLLLAAIPASIRQQNLPHMHAPAHLRSLGVPPRGATTYAVATLQAPTKLDESAIDSSVVAALQAPVELEKPATESLFVNGLNTLFKKSPLSEHRREFTNLTDASEFHSKVEDAARHNKAVVIAYLGNKCKSCRAAKPKLERMMQRWPDVEFCKVTVDDNKQLSKSQGVTAIPYFQFYLGKYGKVEEQSARVPRLEEKLDYHTGCGQFPCGDLVKVVQDVTDWG